MRARNYKLFIKTSKGIRTAGYKSEKKLEAGEEIMLFYEGENHIVRIVKVKKGLWPSASAEET